MENPKVAVLFITYNHVNSVAEALESILMQKTTFSYKIIVGDDCSKDGTRDIILSYAKNYPDKIILSNPSANLGAEKNFNQLFARCIATGADYMAYLEGDDYWLDEYRLQKQFDILEKEPETGLVYGKYKTLNQKNEFVPCAIPPYKSGFIFEDIILNKFLPAMHSSFFRTSLAKEIFEQENFMGVDFYIMAEIAKRKQIRYLDEFIFVYRITSGSVTKIQADDVTSQYIKVLSFYKKDYPELYKKGFLNGRRKLLYNQAEDKQSLKNLFLLFRYYEFSLVHQKQIVKWFYLKLKNLIN